LWLIDNEGQLTTNGIITKNSDDFKYDIDHLTTSSFFETSHWQQISNYIKTTIITDIGIKIFSKSQINRLNKNTHKRKKREHTERKKEWEEEQYEKKRSEKKQEAKRKADQRRLLNVYFKNQKKSKNDLKAFLKKVAAQRKAQEKRKTAEIRKKHAKTASSKKESSNKTKRKAA
jgi:hypothetical protein